MTTFTWANNCFTLIVQAIGMEFVPPAHEYRSPISVPTNRYKQAQYFCRLFRSSREIPTGAYDSKSALSNLTNGPNLMVQITRSASPGIQQVDVFFFSFSRSLNRQRFQFRCSAQPVSTQDGQWSKLLWHVSTGGGHSQQTVPS